MNEKEIQEIIAESKEPLAALKKKYFSADETQNSKEIAAREKELKNNRISFNHGYRGKGGKLYTNILKASAYKELHYDELRLISSQKAALKNHIGNTHLAIACGDLNKEVQMYKAVL